MKTVEWDQGMVKMIDQTKLPEEEIIWLKDYREVAAAIKDLKVRGAPAIGVTAALGLALGAQQSKAATVDELFKDLATVSETLRRTRPTAVNLAWALERMNRKAQEVANLGVNGIKEALLKEAQTMAVEDVEANRSMGAYGGALLNDGDVVLTHCNAGALATVDYGTALGVIRGAIEQGKRIEVYADETRPFLQGARLTCYELQRDGIPVTLITDNMAGWMMHLGRVNAVVVGADRIAANGDVANKIGTYSVAVLAKENGIPFYVAAPTSTIDIHLPSGNLIPVEERSPEEVVYIAGKRIAPEGVRVAYPAFDVTPNRYVTAIITEEGVVRAPYTENLKKLFE